MHKLGSMGNIVSISWLLVGVSWTAFNFADRGLGNGEVEWSGVEGILR